MNRFYLFLVSPSFAKLPDGGFDVAAQLLRQTVHLYFSVSSVVYARYSSALTSVA